MDRNIAYVLTIAAGHALESCAESELASLLSIVTVG